MRCLRHKIVTTLKPHKCWGCRKEFPANTKMFCNTSVVDNEISSVYWCSKCSDVISKLSCNDFEDGILYGEIIDNYKEEFMDQTTIPGLLEPGESLERRKKEYIHDTSWEPFSLKENPKLEPEIYDYRIVKIKNISDEVIADFMVGPMFSYSFNIPEVNDQDKKIVGNDAIVSRQRYMIELRRWAKGGITIARACDGLNALELTGLLQMTLAGINDQLKGVENSPTKVKRFIITD